MLLLGLFCIIGTKCYSQKRNLFYQEKDSFSNTIIEYKYYLGKTKPDTIYYFEIFRNFILSSRGYINSIKRPCILCKVGVHQVYYPSGDLYSIGIYDASGFKDSTWKYYYEENVLSKEVTYSNNMIIGNYKEYYENGKTKSEGEYTIYEKNIINTDFSSKFDVWKYYYPSGRLRRQECYLNKATKRVNTQDVMLLSDGTIDTSMYLRNIKNGEWRYWSKAGKLIKIEIYDKDKLIETKTF